MISSAVVDNAIISHTVMSRKDIVLMIWSHFIYDKFIIICDKTSKSFAKIYNKVSV